MSDILREIDDELRQERVRAFWKKYGVYLGIAVVGFIGAVAGIRGYEAWNKSVVAQSGTQYSQAISLLENENTSEASEILENLSAEGHAAYPQLAKMRQAAALAAAGDRDGAVEIYDAVIAESGADGLLKDVARLRAALILVDTAPLGEIRNRVGGLADEDGPWRHTAREIIALSAYRSEDFAEADAEYDRIMGDPATPAGIRGRAEMMRTLIAPHLAETVTQ